MNLEKLKRTIIHELGHYVARKLTLGEEGLAKCKLILSIKKKKNSITNELDYEGSLTKTKIIDPKTGTPIINVVDEVVVSVYGCIFQALYEGSEFKTCFNCLNKNLPDSEKYIPNGMSDFDLIRDNQDAEVAHKLRDYVNDFVMKSLNRNISIFEPLFNIDVLSYIKENQEIELENLELMYVDCNNINEVEVLLELHKSEFETIRNEIQQIINLRRV